MLNVAENSYRSVVRMREEGTDMSFLGLLELMEPGETEAAIEQVLSESGNYN